MGFISSKLDMSEAYDMIKLDYLEKIIFIIGFDSSLVNLIMQCIGSVPFLVLINGAPLMDLLLLIED